MNTNEKQSPEDVVFQAVSTLIEGIYRGNNCDTQYSKIKSADDLSTSQIPTIRNALKAAKTRLNQEIDDFIARLSHRWNTTSAVHRLPTEVLIMIMGEFKLTQPNQKDHTSLFDLLLVCRTWNDTIMHSPRLWGSFHSKMPYKIAQLVIQRSEPSPLSITWEPLHGPFMMGDWSWVQGLKSRSESLRHLVLENSARIGRIDATGEAYPASDLRVLLEAPTPALEALRVVDRRNDYHVVGQDLVDEFILSDGSPLKHLSLDGITTPLDSPRLSNLITLALAGSAVPTFPGDLLHILSISRQLEVVRITNRRPRDTKITLPNALVTLPHLRELVLWSVECWYISAVLGSIYAPSCHWLEVSDIRVEVGERLELDDLIWQPGNEQAAIILGRTPSLKSLSICFGGGEIAVVSPPSTGECRNLHFRRDDMIGLMTRLVAVLSQLPSPPPVELYLHEPFHRGFSFPTGVPPLTGVPLPAGVPFHEPFIPPPAVHSLHEPFIPPPAIYSLHEPFIPPPAGHSLYVPPHGGITPLELAPWSEHVESLLIEGGDYCQSVLEQLSQRLKVPGTDKMDWICPRLSSIVLVYSSGDREDAPRDVEALSSLIHHRWASKDDIPTATQPAVFEVHCKKVHFPSFWSIESGVKKVVPSFQVVEYEARPEKMEWLSKRGQNYSS